MKTTPFEMVFIIRDNIGTNRVLARRIVLRDELNYDGVTLLTYRIEYPEFGSHCYRTCLKKVNEFYKYSALGFRRYCETVLFELAVEQYKGDIENGFPIRTFEAVLTFKVTYLCSCIISIYSDRYEFTGGAHGNTIRESQTWGLNNCGLLELCQLVRCPPDCKTYILVEAEKQIEKEPEIYFENYTELISETFNENSFYCTPRGIVVYYQQYDIAPYSSGIREFLVPYTACVINPKKFCRVI